MPATKEKDLEAVLATTPTRTPFVDDFVKALQNVNIAEALGAIFDKKLKYVLSAMADLQDENKSMKRELIATNARLEQLYAHDRK